MHSKLVGALSLALSLGMGCVSGTASAGTRVVVEGDIARGVYGRIVIGDRPPPPVIVQQPVIVAPAPPQLVVVQGPTAVYTAPPPVYIYAPPGHYKKWAKHCHRYGACGQPVYFVKTSHHRRGHKPHRHDD